MKLMPSLWAYKMKNAARRAELDHQEPDSAAKSPIPYFCHVEGGGMADKLCLSPVNPKSVDTVFPVKNGGEMTQKASRLRKKAPVVSVGCGCRPLCRKRKHTKEPKINAPPSVIVPCKTTDSNAGFRWEEEEGWHVVAKVNDEITRKKLAVLRRSTGDQNRKTCCPPGSPVSSPDGISVNNSPCFVGTDVQRITRKHRKKKNPTRPRVHNKFSDMTGCCNNYRLSTSSGDTAFGSFASDDEDETLFSSCERSTASDHCKSFSSESSIDCYEARLSTIDEMPRNFRRSKTPKTRRRSKNLSRRKSPPTALSDENQDLSAGHGTALSSSDSGKLEAKDSKIVANAGQSMLSSLLNSEAEDNLEANAKTWRSGTCGYRRDDIRTVIYKTSEIRQNPHCLPFSMVACTRDSRVGKNKVRASRKPSPTKKIVPNSSEKRRSPRRKSEKRESLMPAEIDGKVGESVAVVKSSEDPYNDFRDSMLEMILEKQIFQPNDLEKLLQCFLSLNSRQHHGVIVEAFKEIWGAIFHGTKNSSRTDL